MPTPRTAFLLLLALTACTGTPIGDDTDPDTDPTSCDVDRDGDGICDDIDPCVQLDASVHGDWCDVVFVNPEAAGKGDGSSWEDGFATLDAAVDEAVRRGADGEPHEVWMVTATFRPPAPGRPVLTMPEGLVLRGGYRADSTHVDDRGAAPTVFDGDFEDNDRPLDLATVEAERDAPDQPTRSDNAPTVLIMPSRTTLEYVEITGGYAPDVRQGVGIHVPPASEEVRILGAYMHHNIGAVWNANGGGLGVGNRAQVKVQGCTFEANVAWNGASIDLSGASDALVYATTFYSNGAMSQGAGIHLLDGSAHVLSSRFIANHMVENHGVAFVAVRSSGRVTNALFDSNVGPGPIQITESSMELSNLTVVGHTDTNDTAALRGSPGTVLTNSVFYGNTLDIDPLERLQPGAIHHTCAESDLRAFDPSNRVLDGRSPEAGSPFSTVEPGMRYLAHRQAGDAATSICVDAGDDEAGEAMVPAWTETTTRADQVPDGADGDPIDAGFHHFVR